MEIKILSYLIVLFSLVNLFRMALFLIGSDIYEILQLRRRKAHFKYFRPQKVSVIIPAFNEESTIFRAVLSVFESKYKNHLLEAIVVDDGSTDKTAEIVSEFIKNNPSLNVKLIKQKNIGKAHALNSGVKEATGELIMCLDADSYLDSHAILNASRYFLDPQVAALASNVKIIKRSGLLNLVQLYEYLICYQMKRAESLFNCEYIIGGIGSVFRRSVIEKINYYDGNTVTEDIDITMKALQLGNKKHKFIYGSNVVTYTESVLTIPDLLRQRFRWKWGRCQTFLKNTNLFLSTDKKHSKTLTWFYLPFALYGDLAYFVEPILLAYLLAVSIYFNSFATILGAWLTISAYVVINVLAENTISTREKIRLFLIAPFMYFLLYILSFVEYVALIRALIKSPSLAKSLKKTGYTWKHVDRVKKPRFRPNFNFPAIG